MRSRRMLWIAVAIIIAVFAAYALTRGGPSRPGQSPPHAIDQSRTQ
jgi:hypothetical protein